MYKRQVFNAYLVETGGGRLLIDAGAGVHMGPNAGKMLEKLAECGVAPGDVDAIILTHCHPDHILGIVDKDWNAVFPNAELVVPELDEQFWLRSDPSKIDNEYQRVDAERAVSRCSSARSPISWSWWRPSVGAGFRPGRTGRLGLSNRAIA